MISVLLPTYNGEKFLKQSIESVLNQTFKEFELLIGLNGTTDSSREIINEFDSDSRIRVFDYTEKGKSKTLNKLLSESKYEWIALQDDDDIWLPKKLEKQIMFIHNYDVIGTFINYINENGDLLGSPSLHSFHDEIVDLSRSGNNQIANSSVLILKKSLQDSGNWNENLDSLPEQGYQALEDYELWLRLIRNNKKFFNIPEQLVLHRIHDNSKFNTKKYDLSKIL